MRVVPPPLTLPDATPNSEVSEGTIEAATQPKASGSPLEGSLAQEPALCRKGLPSSPSLPSQHGLLPAPPTSLQIDGTDAIDHDRMQRKQGAQENRVGGEHLIPRGAGVSPSAAVPIVNQTRKPPRHFEFTATELATQQILHNHLLDQPRSPSSIHQSGHSETNSASTWPARRSFDSMETSVTIGDHRVAECQPTAFPRLLGKRNDAMKPNSVNLSIERSNQQSQSQTLLCPPDAETMRASSKHLEGKIGDSESKQLGTSNGSCCPPFKRLFCACWFLVGRSQSYENGLLESSQKVLTNERHLREAASDLQDQLHQRNAEIEELRSDATSLKREADSFRCKAEEYALVVVGASQEMNKKGMQTEDLIARTRVQQEHLVRQRQEIARWHRKWKKRGRKLRESRKNVTRWQTEAASRKDEADRLRLTVEALNVILKQHPEILSSLRDGLTSSPSTPTHQAKLPYSKDPFSMDDGHGVSDNERSDSDECLSGDVERHVHLVDC